MPDSFHRELDCNSPGFSRLSIENQLKIKALSSQQEFDQFYASNYQFNASRVDGESTDIVVDQRQAAPNINQCPSALPALHGVDKPSRVMMVSTSDSRMFMHITEQNIWREVLSLKETITTKRTCEPPVHLRMQPCIWFDMELGDLNARSDSEVSLASQSSFQPHRSGTCKNHCCACRKNTVKKRALSAVGKSILCTKQTYFERGLRVKLDTEWAEMNGDRPTASKIN